MEYLSQFLIIFLFAFIGELIHAVVPLPVPGSVYGLILLFAALCLGIVKLKQVEKLSDKLLELMPMFFIPPGVSLITTWADIKGVLLPFIVIVVVSTLIVMAVTGVITQKLIRRSAGKERSNG